MNDKDPPVNLADEMKASSQRRFEMKNEAEVNETATKRKTSGSKISAYMEQKLDKKSQEYLHIMLLQALIWVIFHLTLLTTRSLFDFCPNYDLHIVFQLLLCLQIDVYINNSTYRGSKYITIL